MNDRDALLRTIIESPEDDVPRLVFADWLDENGEPERAEVIRAECERDRLPERDPRRDDLDARAAELWAAHRDEWLGPLAGPVRRFRSRGGFVHSVDLPARAFLDHADWLFREVPLRGLWLTELGRAGYRLAESPHLERLTGLGFYGGLRPATAVRAVIASPRLAALRTLDPSMNELRVEGCRTIAANAALRNLRELDLYDCRVDNFGAELLASAEHLRELRALNLASNLLSDTAAEAIADAPHLANLSALNLHGNQVGPRGVRALTRSPHLTALAELDLEDNPIGAEGLRVLAEWPRLGGLRDLKLGGPDLPAADVAALLASPALSLLEGLWLSDTPLGDAGVEAVVEALGGLGELTELTLWNVGCGVRGAAALARWPGLARLRLLYLQDNPLRDEGVVGLLCDPARPLPGLADLALDSARVENAGVRALAASPNFPNLRRLSLKWNRITDAGAKALAASPRLARLRSLELGDNRIGPAGRRALAGRFGGAVSF